MATVQRRSGLGPDADLVEIHGRRGQPGAAPSPFTVAGSDLPGLPSS